MLVSRILWQINEAQTLDSEAREDGWTVTGRGKGRGVNEISYIAFNTGSGHRKSVYMVAKKKGGIRFTFLISRANQLCQKFRQCYKEQKLGTWGENNRDYFVTCLCPITGMSEGDVRKLVVTKLDELYRCYDNSVNPVNAQDTKTSVCKQTCIETLDGPTMCPSYEFKAVEWGDYISKWDKFIKAWYDSGAQPDDALTRGLAAAFAANQDTGLDKTELPEPYYGNPEKASGVIVNLNPGASCEGEDTKRLGGNGFLINSFSTDCQCQYSLFAERWSPLRSEFENVVPGRVCGYDWWHNDNRKRWIKNFLNADISNMFALEACPYHSQAWTGGMDGVEKHIVENVICPAIQAASGKDVKVKCAVFIGGLFNQLISKLKGVEFRKRQRGTRTYSLYSYRLGGREVFMLVINGVQHMWLPRAVKANSEIEADMLKLIKGT